MLIVYLSAGEKVTCFLLNPEFRNRVHKRLHSETVNVKVKLSLACREGVI